LRAQVSDLADCQFDWSCNNRETEGRRALTDEDERMFKRMQALCADGWRLGFVPFRDTDGKVVAADPAALARVLLSQKLAIFVPGEGRVRSCCC
jgi:hypothetical protein